MQPRPIQCLLGCVGTLLVALGLTGGCPGPADVTPSGSGDSPSNGNATPTAVLGIQYGPATIESPTDLPAVDVQDVTFASLANRPVDVPLTATGGNGGAAQFEIAATPEFGTLGSIVSTGAMSALVRYTPPTDFVGQVAFSYRAMIDGAVSRDALVQVTVHPEIRFALSATQGPSPLTVTMTALTVQGTPLPEGSYAWRIGDTTSEGPVSTHGSRTHVFTRAGQFAVGLTVMIATLSQPIVCEYEADQSTQALVRVDEPTVRIRGTVRTSSGAPLAGVPVVSADGAHSAQSAASGEYAIVVPQGWSGSIAPVGATQFEPPQRSYAALQNDIAGQDFAQVAPQQPPPGHLSVSIAATPTSTGTVGGPFAPPAHTFVLSNTGGAPLDWAVGGSASWLSISSLAGPLGADDTVVVTASINVIANSLPPGTYAQQLTFINQTNGAGGGMHSVTLVIQPPPELVIGGRITDAGGTPISDVAISGLPGNPVTDENGDYYATVSYGWSGTAMPGHAGYTFSPASRTYTDLTDNLTSEDYTAAVASYTISGRVTDVGGVGMSGVTINGLPGNPVTNSNGDYSATVDFGWSGTGTPSKAGYSFSPASRTYSNVTANQANQGYTAATVTYTISGRVADSGGSGISGVTIAGLPGEPTTNTNGDYSSTVVSGWSGTITPTKAGYNFVPSARTYSNVTSNQSGQNFTASLLSYTISGRVTDGSGVPLDSVQLVGLPGDPTTDTNGNYSVSVTHGWSGTATPTKADYTFVPASRTYTSIGGAQSAQDYTGTSAGGPLMASSISQYGITWTFDKPYRVGQFVTGDWWVIPEDPNGSVTVSSVSPAPQVVAQGSIGPGSTPGSYRVHGSMVNPSDPGKHAFDERVNGFDLASYVAFPRPLTASSSLVSTISWLESDANHPAQYGSIPNAFRPTLRVAAVLTCVAEAPPADAFRPPYAGTAKPLHRESSVNYGLLPSLATAPIQAHLPPHATASTWAQRVWLDSMTTWSMDALHPSENLPNYGRDLAARIHDVALLALLDLPSDEERTYSRQLIQVGIDHFGVLQVGGNWGTLRGGIGHGRYWPILFAGIMLNDAPMLDVSAQATRFAENTQTFHVSQADIDRDLWVKCAAAVASSTPSTVTGTLTWAGRNGNQLYGYSRSIGLRVQITQGTGSGQVRICTNTSQIRGQSLYVGDSLTLTVDQPWDALPDTSSEFRVLGYAAGDLGLPEWSQDHLAQPVTDNPSWLADYRQCCTANSWHGAMVAALRMNAQSLWNHDAFFDYTDRYMATESGTWRSWTAFSEAMWNAHRTP